MAYDSSDTTQTQLPKKGTKAKNKSETELEDTLKKYRGEFTEYCDNTIEEREDSERGRDYFDGKQYTAEETATLEARGQPIIVDNKIKDKVEYMEGVERRGRTDPKAYPRTQAHEQDAEVATESIRYVFDKNRFPIIKSAVFQNLLIEGFGGCEVIVDKKDPKKILIRKYRWDRIYRDPYSMEPDCSDARYRGLITWMDTDHAKEKWKDKEDVIDSTTKDAPSSAGSTSHDDKPRWVDSKRKRIQIFEHYCHEDGTIQRSVFCWGGFLEDPAECPYVNDEDEHEDPMVLQSAYIDRDGKRYGLVQRYMSLQEELNKRRSKSLHLLNSVNIIADAGAVESIKDARDQVHRPDGYVEKVQGMEFLVERHLDLSAAHFQLLQEASQALSTTGPNAALLGQSGSISGRAKELDQQGGALQIGVLFDAIRDWQLRVSRAVWNRIRQYWDQEMWIRVTDDERGFRFVPINQPKVQGDLMAEQLRGQPPEVIQQAVQQIAQDPRAQMPVIGPDGQQVKKNEVAKLDMDIILDESPDIVTLQQEEFQKLIELAKVRPEVPFDVLLETSQLRGDVKKRVLDKLEKQQQVPPQVQQQMQQQAEALQKAAQEVQAREEGLQKMEQQLTETGATIKGDAASLDVQRAEMKVQAADLKVMEANLATKQAQFEAQVAKAEALFANRETQMVKSDGQRTARERPT